MAALILLGWMTEMMLAFELAALLDSVKLYDMIETMEWEYAYDRGMNINADSDSYADNDSIYYLS